MFNYRLLIQYDGGRYKGWQRLGKGENTIQGKIENVLSEMLGKNIEIIGSSRTDAGVHALAQVANFKTETKLNLRDTKRYLVKYLPADISITELESVHEKFHARYNAAEKTYLYKIWNHEYPNPFMRKYSKHVDKELDISKMKAASLFFLGKHDFTAFSNAKSKKKTMVREIYSLDILEEDGFINIRMSGDGFLYNMARKVSGMLIAVGLSEVEGEKIPEIIDSKDRSKAGYIANSHGLYLERINFKQ